MRRRLARALTESTLMHAQAAADAAEGRAALRSGIASFEALRRLLGIGTEDSLVEAVKRMVAESNEARGEAPGSTGAPAMEAEGPARGARERAEAAGRRAELRCEELEKEVMVLRQRPFTIELQEAERLRAEAVEGRQAAEAAHEALRAFLEESRPEALQAYEEAGGAAR